MTVAPKLTIQGGTTEILRGIIARGWGCDEYDAAGTTSIRHPEVAAQSAALEGRRPVHDRHPSRLAC